MSAVSEETAVAPSKFPAVVYDITAERIAELREIEKAHDPAASTKAYEEACKFRHALVKTRTGMDDKRKEMKADSLAWGRLVDSGYKQWETPLLEIQAKIDAKIKAVDEAKAAKRREKEEAERKALEAELEAKRAAEAAAIKAEQDRIAEANRIEAERLAKIAAEQAAKQREIDEANAKIKAEQEAAQKKIDDAKAEVEAAKRKQEQEERERQIRIQAEKDAAERIEREQKAAAERKAAQERAEAAERARIEAARPDVEKIHELADDIDGIGFPDVSDGKAKLFLAEIDEALESLAKRCRGFKA